MPRMDKSAVKASKQALAVEQVTGGDSEVTEAPRALAFVLRAIDDLRYSRAISAITRKLHAKEVHLTPLAKRTRRLRKERDKASAVKAGPSKASTRRRKVEAVQDVPAAQTEQLHALWVEYSTSILSALPSAQVRVVATAVQRLDRHGAKVRVVGSRCPSHVGVFGIVIKETARTLVIAPPSSTQVTIPKHGCTLQLMLHTSSAGANALLALPASVILRGDSLLLTGAE
mmetsp:Transcript_25290/g.49036  ORF Transcript_25290/g.49036 Transcript_25290/m.49036 type:complete len:229 (-) Transcript_25290:309-995(-)